MNITPVMYADPSGRSWNSFWKGVGNWFKDAGQWVNDKVIQPIGNFFSDTVPDFFANTVYEQGLKPAWDAMANFFSNSIPNFFVNTVWNDFMVGTIYQKGLLAAWNWTKNTANRFGNWMSNNWETVVDWTGAILGIAALAVGILAYFITLPVSLSVTALVVGGAAVI